MLTLPTISAAIAGSGLAMGLALAWATPTAMKPAPEPAWRQAAAQFRADAPYPGDTSMPQEPSPAIPFLGMSDDAAEARAAYTAALVRVAYAQAPREADPPAPAADAVPYMPDTREPTAGAAAVRDAVLTIEPRSAPDVPQIVSGTALAQGAPAGSQVAFAD